MIEFLYNNSDHAGIQMALFDTLYGLRCCSPLYWDHATEVVVLGPSLIQEMIKQVRII